MKTFFRSLYFRLTRDKRSAGAVRAAQTRKRNDAARKKESFASASSIPNTDPQRAPRSVDAVPSLGEAGS